MNKKVFLSIVLAVFGTFVFSNSVFAYTAVEQKALGYGVYRCYNHLKEGDTNNDVVVGEISFRGVNNYKSLILSNSGDGDSAIALPTGFDGLHRIENDSNISCRDLFGGVDYFGSTGFAGLLGSEKDPQNIEDKKKLLNTLSYASQDGGTGGSGQCFKFKYTFGSLGANYQWQTSDGETAAVCSTTGRVTQSDILFDNNSDSVTNFSLDGNTLTMNLWTLNTSTTQMGGGYSTTSNIYDKKTYTLSNYSSFTALSDAVYADYSAYYGRGRDGWSGGSPNLRIRNVTIPVEASVHFPYGERVGTEEEYSLSPSREQASLIAASNLLGGSFNNVQDLAFLAEEEYSLYKTYFDDYYAAEFQCDYGPGQSVTEDSLKNLGYSKITGGSLDGCYAKPTKNADKEVYGLSEAKYFNGQVHLSFEDLIQKFSLSAEAADKSREDVISDIASDATKLSPDAKAEATCQNKGGAGSLGWIVCSILDLMKSATDGLYKDVVKPSLNIQPELFTEGGEDSGAQKAWGIFRDFANIIFIILTLFVIFSQLTGVGIDNYGIKKILPKLIIAAVLINLSYVICLICVDLSNIVGNGIQDLLNGINTTSSVSLMGKNIDTGTTDVNGAADVGIVAVSVTAVAIGIYAIYSNPALLLTLFIAVLGVFIAVLFIFILLAGRKAAIVLLTVVSPIAFILYMLPNTKKIYDKWFNLWKAMLLVYPICGLLIGGGNFASKLMLTIGDNSKPITAFTAMVVGIVPIFFIPNVIKSAYTALGSIGGTIAGFGGRLRGGFTRRASNSQAYQRAQKRSQDRSQRIGAMRRAGVRLDKDGNVVESGRPTARLRRRMAGTWAGRRLGMEASMGRSFNEFAGMEAARRGGIASNDIEAMNAAFAGFAEKEAAQRVSNQEVLIKGGKARLRDGTEVNVNNADSMRYLHGQLLEAAHKAKASGNNAAYNSYMDQIKAAQNIMAKSDVGRGNIQANYAAAAGGGNTEGLKEAASHLIGAHGSDIKASNRAMHALAQDLASGMNASDVETRLLNNTYNIKSIGGYNAQSLAAADEMALKELRANINAIKGNDEARNQLTELVNEALSNPNIQPQEKVRKQLEDIRSSLQGGRNPIGF